MPRRMAVDRLLVAAILGSLLASCGDSGGGVQAPSGPGWGTATPVGTTGLGDAGIQRVAMDNGGNVTVAWLQSGGAQTQVWANRFSPASGWDVAVPLDNNPNGDAEGPQVAMDNSGNAVVVWRQPDGTRNNIWAGHYVSGKGWAPPVPVTDNTGSDADFPHVAMDSAGNAVAVWKQSDGVHYSIWADCYDPVNGWGTATLVSASIGDSDNPRVALDGSGNALVVWNQDDGGTQNIWSARYDKTGSKWDPPAQVSNGAGNAFVPRLAINGGGIAMAVWEQSDGTFNHIWASRYASGTGSWDPAVMTETDNSVSSGRADVGIDSAGNAVAVWEQSDGTRTSIWASRFTPSSGWGSTSLLENDPGDAGRPEVAMDGGGNAVAVWQQSDGVAVSIRANRFTLASGWGTAVTLDSATPDAEGPRVAAANGRAAAVWQQSDGGFFNIWANLFR